MKRFTDTAVCGCCGKRFDWVCAFPTGEEIVPEMWKRLQKNINKYYVMQESYFVEIKCPYCGGNETLSFTYAK